MDFLKYCMRVNGVTAYWPTRNEASREPLSANPNWRKRYYVNNGVLAFVTENGDYYVTPYWREVAEELEKLGYSNAGMYVPFSNWDKPNNVTLAKAWEELCADAKKESAKAEKTENIVKGKGLIDLPEEVYGMCLAVPEAGILVEKINGGKQIDKIVDGQKIFDRIGTYCRNNGKLVFIDGTTYVYQDKAIYRDKVKICENITDFLFTIKLLNCIFKSLISLSLFLIISFKLEIILLFCC